MPVVQMQHTYIIQLYSYICITRWLVLAAVRSMHMPSGGGVGPICHRPQSHYATEMTHVYLVALDRLSWA